jgi:uncharacterized tellurite resistance protein B-like protein
VAAQTMTRALELTGQPTEAHVQHAARIIASLPDTIIEAARESYGARALIFALLTHREPEVRAKQLAQLELSVDHGLYYHTTRLLPAVEALPPEARLPLIDLSVAALRALSSAQYQQFKENLTALANADNRIDLFEWMLQRVLLSHVEPQFSPVRPPRVRHQGLERLRGSCEVLLSTVAYVGTADNDLSHLAFERGAAYLGLPGLSMIPRERCSLDVLDRALSSLAEAAPRLKKQLLGACASVITADNQVTAREAEILRAISDTLGCPMPPLL